MAIILSRKYIHRISCDTSSTFAGIRPDFNRTDLAKFEAKTFPAAGSRIQSKCLGDCVGHDNNYLTIYIYCAILLTSKT